MLIDDDEEDQEIFWTALHTLSHPFVSMAYTNASDAITYLESGAQLPDVIFLDLNLPALTGDAFLKHIKSSPALHRLPVIVLSTSRNQETIDAMMALGASHFISKPNSFDQFIELLQPVLH